MNTHIDVIEEHIRFTSFPEHIFVPQTKPHSLGSNPLTLRFSFFATSQQTGNSELRFTIFFFEAHHQLSSSMHPQRESIKLPKTDEKKVIMKSVAKDN